MSYSRSSHSQKVNAQNQIEIDIAAISTTAELPVNLDEVGGVAVTLGAKAGSASVPVVLANDTDVACDLAKVGGATFDLGQEAMTGSVPVVLASNQSAINVNATSTVAAVSGLENNMENNQSVAAGDTSTEIDIGQMTMVTIFGTGTGLASTTITVEISAAATNWYPMDRQIMADGDGNFFLQIENIAVKRIRLKWTATATAVYATCQSR